MRPWKEFMVVHLCCTKKKKIEREFGWEELGEKDQENEEMLPSSLLGFFY